MRTLPFGRSVDENSVRSVVVKNGDVFCGTSGVKICRQVAPASSEREMPSRTSAANTVFELRGSSSMWFEPRFEHGFVPTGCGGLHANGPGPPSNRNVQVAPPSVVFQMPHAAAPGLSDAAPPLTDETPRTPRVSPT